MPDSIQRAKYISYFVGRLKKEIPNGINSVSKDSLQSLNAKIGKEYAFKTHDSGERVDLKPYYEKWSPLIDKSIREAYKQLLSAKGNDYTNNCSVPRVMIIQTTFATV